MEKHCRSFVIVADTNRITEAKQKLETATLSAELWLTEMTTVCRYKIAIEWNVYIVPGARR